MALRFTVLSRSVPAGQLVLYAVCFQKLSNGTTSPLRSPIRAYVTHGVVDPLVQGLFEDRTRPAMRAEEAEVRLEPVRLVQEGYATPAHV